MSADFNHDGEERAPALQHDFVGHTVTPEHRLIGLIVKHRVPAADIQLKPEHFHDPDLRYTWKRWERLGSEVDQLDEDAIRARTGQWARFAVWLIDEAGAPDQDNPIDPIREIATLAEQIRGHTEEPPPPPAANDVVAILPPVPPTAPPEIVEEITPAPPSPPQTPRLEEQEYQADDHGTNVKPKQPEPKSKPRDVNDILQQHGEDAVRDALDQALSEDPNPEPSSVRHNESGKGEKALPENRAAKRNAGAVAAALAGLKTATALQTMTFPQLKYIIPDLIVEGCVLLAGKPKVRKSWLAYDVGLAVASGGYCLGDKKCAQGEVLFLALEDGDRRLQRRATKLLPTFSGKWPERFYYATKWPRASEGGIEAIDQWCEAHPDARLVVIDVLARFRAPSTNKNAYEQDYEAVSRLQELAVRRSITVLIVHHTRKGAAEDPVEEISGTLGLGGGVDAFLILKRTSSGGTLIGRGRDTEDVDLAMQFNDETCRWTILGQAADVQRSEQRGRVLVALEGAIEGLPTSEIVSHAHLTSRAAADVLLSDMAKDGQVERVKRGVYALPGTKIAKKDKKGDEYGENGANDHTRPHTRPSNESKAQGEAAHTPDPPGHVSVIEFLRWALTPGRRLVSDIEASARADGLLGEHQRIDTKPFRAAKMILGVVVEREGFGPGSKVYWRLPDSPDQGSPGSQTGCDTGVQMLEPGGDGQ